MHHNLALTKLKCIMNNHVNNEIMKITSNSGICKTIYHNDSYLLLFGTRKLQSFGIFYMKIYSCFEISTSHQ